LHFIFRKGFTEFIDNTIEFELRKDNKKWVNAYNIELAYINAALHCILSLKAADVGPPYSIFLGVMGSNSLHLDTSDRVDNAHGFAFDRNQMLMQDVTLNDMPQSLEVEAIKHVIASALRPAFDELWQGAGHPECKHFDDAGRFRAPPHGAGS
jgi:hypothetical protein